MKLDASTGGARCSGARTGRMRPSIVLIAVLVCCVSALIATEARGASAGSLDRNFSSDGKKLTDLFARDDRTYDLAVQPDGRVLVAGESRKPDRNARMTLARYRRDGSVDRSFDRDGFAFVRRFSDGPYGRNEFYDSRGTTLVMQTSRKILVAGDESGDLALARFRSNGELDRRFGRSGKVVTKLLGLNRAEDVAIQPNGKIVIAGHKHPAGSGEFELLLARYKRDGTLDRSFGDGGSLRTTFGLDTYAQAFGVVLQPDGKIVVSGELGGGFIVARFRSDGSLDTGFGNNAGFQDLEPFGAGSAKDVAVLPDGKILAAGSIPGSRGGDFGLARYLPDGSPDSTFGDEGGVRTSFGASRNRDGAYALTVQPDGRIVAAGDSALNFSKSRFAVARYMPDGNLDVSFAGDGKARFGFPRKSAKGNRSFAEAVATTPRGRIVVAGWSAALRGPGGSDDDFALARLLGAPG